MQTIRGIRRIVACRFMLVALTVALLSVGDNLENADAQSIREAKPTQSKAARFAELENSLTNSVLIGNFTVTERGQDGPPKLIPERYELSAVKHQEGDNWLFKARIKYGEHDVTIPLTLPVKWAGDTPIITVDEIPFPGMGTYTARVMIYRDHYAGFWTGADHGGHLFGVVERNAGAKSTSAASEPPTNE